MTTSAATPHLTPWAIALLAALACLMVLTPSISVAATAGSYPNVTFSDGFASGLLSAWDGTMGSPGTVSVTAAGAHSDSYGVRLTNAPGQYGLVMKNLATPLADSSVSFWARVNSTGGVQTLAQARDRHSSHFIWSVLYDATRQGIWFYPITVRARARRSSPG